MSATTLSTAFTLLLMHALTAETQCTGHSGIASAANSPTPCFPDYTCPGGRFCFMNTCLSNRTVGESCRYGIQCQNLGAYCSGGFCSCVSEYEDFDGQACVVRENSSSFPLVTVVLAALFLQILTKILITCFLKYRNAKRALSATSKIATSETHVVLPEKLL